MTFLRRHFPENSAKWKIYSKVFIPIILGSSLFALNGVVDNFMVGSIEQGQSALGAINSWTSILIGWFAGTASAGSVLAGQFYFAKEYKVVKEISRYRYYLCMIPAIILAIIAWTAPDILTKTFAHYPSDKGQNDLNLIAFEKMMSNAREYARVIAIQWILISITFNLGNQLREIGYGVYTMYWGVGTLAANMALNSILIYWVGMGVAGAAWASVAGRIVSLLSGIIVILVKKLEIGFNPLTLFQTSWDSRKLFWKRWIYILSVSTVTFFVIYRTSIFSLGYPNGSLGIGVSGLSVLALTGAIMNVFTTTFNALTAMSSRFVGSELGNGNLLQAQKNGDELKGFLTLAACFFSILMILFSFIIPHLSFLAETKYENGNMSFSGSEQLWQVSKSLLVIALFYPIWIWFTTSYRIGNSGGKGSKFAIADWIISALQLVWLFCVVKAIVPKWNFAESNFWIAYTIFFLSDLIKLFFMEKFYYKYNWLNTLTDKNIEGQKAKSQDITEFTDINRRDF